jgi:hypothetical protein
MLANPSARKMLLQARKLSDPSVVIPEIDAAAPVNATLDEIKKQLAEDKAERAAERAAAEQQRQVDKFTQGWERQKSLLRSQNWSDEGIAAVEQHAHDRGIPDLEIAAAHFEKLHPPSEPVTSSSTGSWGFMENNAEDDTFVKAMIESQGNDEAALDREIAASLKDYRAQNGNPVGRR